MRPAVLTVNGTGVSAPYVVDQYLLANMALATEYNGTGNPSSPVSFNVEHTYDDILTIDRRTGLPVLSLSAATWRPNADISVNNATTSAAILKESNYAYNPIAIRLNVSQAPTNSVITLVITQSGGAGRS